MIGINRMSDRERWINPDKRERERDERDINWVWEGLA